MTARLPLLTVVLSALALNAAAEPIEIADSAGAIRAAQRYTKGRCVAEPPCKYKAEKEGNQWRVWVRIPKRSNPREITNTYPAGTIVLFFDRKGHLLRRLEAD